MDSNLIEAVKKQVVNILSTSEEDDGYGYDFVDSKKAVDKFFLLAEKGSAENIAEYLYNSGLVGDE